MHNTQSFEHMTGFQCNYCFQKWQKRENMEKHALMCGFWHRTQKIHEDDYDTTPSVSELYKLLKEFAYKCDKLQKRVDQLENRQNTRQKKQILDYLQEHPASGSATSLFRTFKITQDHLDTVFETDLTAGIKTCIKSYIQPHSFPICAFTQKPGPLYIYEAIENDIAVGDPKWHIMTTPEMDKLISILSLKFLQAFILWKKDHCPQVDTINMYELIEDEHMSQAHIANEQIKQQHQRYMSKINGQRTNEDKRRNDVKQMLYNCLHKPLPTVIEMI